MESNNFFKKILNSFKRIFSKQKALEAPKQEYDTKTIDFKADTYYDNEKDEKRRVAELYNQLKENKLDLKKLSLTDLKRVNEILDKQIEIEKIYIYSKKYNI